MKPAPKVSVILTSFNHEKYLREAIDSVLGQTYSDFELIIWDDASTDRSWDVIAHYADPRIKAFRNEEHKRGVWGINKAISDVSAGEYIAIHHSDDRWELNKLEKQVAFLDAHPETGAVFTNACAVDEMGLPLTDRNHFYFSIFSQPNRTRHEWLRYFFYHGNALCHPSVLIRKSCYADCGLYRLGLAQVGDFDMWMRLCLQYDIHVLPEKYMYFRVRNNEANASGNRQDTRIRVQYEFYKLLQNYRLLRTADDVIKVFPSAHPYDRKDETDIDFALAMVALEEKPFRFTQLFGLDLLFEIISDQTRAEKVERLYNFDRKDLIVLTGQLDVFDTEAVAKRDRQIAFLNQSLAERDAKLAAVYSSKSWKLTEPLRAIKSFIDTTQSGRHNS